MEILRDIMNIIASLLFLYVVIMFWLNLYEKFR